MKSLAEIDIKIIDYKAKLLTLQMLETLMGFDCGKTTRCVSATNFERLSN